MAKVVIDSGFGGNDPGAVYEGRQEKDDVLDLALAVGEILEERGVDVVYTRTTDVFDTPFEKATIANNADADYFISFHRNASATPGSGEGAEVLVYPGREEAQALAENILDQMVEVGFANRGVTDRPNLVVLKRTKMPAVLIEAGFIDSQSDNEIFDDNFDSLAQGIADGILATVMEDGSVSERRLYRVQVGAYRNSANANRQLNILTRAGFPAYVIFEDGLYRVQVGAYSQLDNAVRMERELRRQGYNTFITT